MNSETIRLRLVGDRPLLMHSGRLADPLDPVAGDLAKVTGKRMKTRADYEEIARIEWHGGLWLSENRPCIPAEAVEACFVKAAGARRKTRQAKAGLMISEPCILTYDGPTEIDELWKNPDFRFRHPASVHKARTMRTRPRFKQWSTEVNADFLPTLLDKAEVLEIFQIAGFREGLGDWRPRYGRFSAQLLE
jgi:hypothetical protein